MRLMGMRLRFRSLGLALLSVAAAGVLLQIGPAQASSKKASRSTASATKQQALERLREASACVHAERRPDRRARPLLRAGRRLRRLSHPPRGDARLPGSGKQRRKGAPLALRFLGANPDAPIRGERPGPGRVNYLLGNDPAKWRTGLRTYGRVVYRDLWPGVDMVFAGQDGKLKYEFLVRPGARVRDIRLAYRGAKRALARPARKPAHRHLARRLPDTRPVSYQLVAGRRVPVRAASRSTGAARATASRSAAYDRRVPARHRPGPRLLDLPGRRRRRRRLRHRGRRRRQRLRDRGHDLGELPDDARAPSTRRSNGGLRRLRDEAERDRRGPRLLDLPGRQRRRPRAAASRSTRRATPT